MPLDALTWSDLRPATSPPTRPAAVARFVGVAGGLFTFGLLLAFAVG